MSNIIEITDFLAPELDVYARLTENQLMAILMYSQGGVKSLENFRNQQANN